MPNSGERGGDAPVPGPLAFTAMTFNVRYDEESDGRHAWAHRRSLALNLLQSYDPDLLGLQEPTEAQWDSIAAALPRHSPFGASADEWGTVERHGGFFRTSRFAPLSGGLFWLSDTPSVAYSESWPSDWGPRACGWVELHDRSADRTLVFACTHFDTNPAAWLPSAKTLHRELGQIAGDRPLILVGDFNCAAGSAAYRYLHDQAGYRDAWREAGNADDGVVTFNGFTPVTRVLDEADGAADQPEASPWRFAPAASHAHLRADGNYRIDWILLRGPVRSTSSIIDYRDDNGLLPSDHYPVVARLEYAAAPPV